MSDLTVGIIMGSESDLPVMEPAREALESFGIQTELTIVSAHRTPDRMFDYAKSAKDRGLCVIIAGAGGAAHLPGMVASLTTLPVIGVPVKSSTSMDGWDSLLSIAQMPKGVPVATVAVRLLATAEPDQSCPPWSTLESTKTKRASSSLSPFVSTSMS